MAALYALATLTPPEREDYLRHLAACRLCRDLVSQFQAAADLLPDTLAPEDPSPRLRQSILERAAHDLAPPAPASGRARPRSRPWGWLLGPSPVPAAALAVLVLAVAGLVAWSVTLSLRLGEQTTALAEQRQLINQQSEELAQQGRSLADQSDRLADQGQLLEAITVGVTPVTLVSADPSGVARASLVHEPGSGVTFLVVRGLPPAPRGMEYQVWHVAGGGTVLRGVATFQSTIPEGQLVVLPVDFSGAESVGVSVEPEGGSPAPTGDIVLWGDL